LPHTVFSAKPVAMGNYVNIGYQSKLMERVTGLSFSDKSTICLQVQLL